MRTTRISLVALAAALIVAAPTFMAAPAYAKGEGGDARYHTYLTNRAKTEAMHQAAAAKQKADADILSSFFDSDDYVGHTGASHYLYAVPLSKEYLYRHG